jgi:hypothetical protein
MTKSGKEPPKPFGPLTPDPDQYKWLTSGLEFLKFDGDTVKDLYDAIGSVINLVSGVVSVVGAVSSMVDLCKTLGIFKATKDPNTVRLEKIGEQIQAMYEYLERAATAGLYGETKPWRSDLSTSISYRDDAQISRSDNVMQDLRDRAAALDTSLDEMLVSGDITFLRSTYGCQPYKAHWIDAAKSPFMTLNNGAPTNLADPSRNLAGTIWDAGYFIDILTRGLGERIALATAVEPAFHSTGYHRDRMGQIAAMLADFIKQWTAAILVANPAAGLNNGGQLLDPLEGNPADGAPVGIAIGAADPITGVSNVQTFSGFEIRYKRTYFPGSAWGGVWDESRAVDLNAALDAANAAHYSLVQQVLAACGIDKLKALEQQYWMLAHAPMESEFVYFRDPVALIRTGPTLVASRQVDLGDLKKYSPNPAKTYAAQEFTQQIGKRFSFNIAKRADTSQIQLGYRLVIGDQSINLCDYSPDPLPPKASQQHTITISAPVLDCYQTGPFSLADEDTFEDTGSPISGQRLLLNQRTEKITLEVDVAFAPDAGSLHFSRPVAVTVRSPDGISFGGAAVVDVMVLETLTGDNFQPEEVLGDQMTVHLVTDYLVAGQDFFTDWALAMQRMMHAQLVFATQKKFSLGDLVDQIPHQPFPDPQYVTMRYDLAARHGVAFLEAVERIHPDAAAVIQRFQLPAAETAQRG